MSLFKCERCGCYENTALCRYWYREKEEKALCSECDTKIGKWHGIFPKRTNVVVVDTFGKSQSVLKIAKKCIKLMRKKK